MSLLFCSETLIYYGISLFPTQLSGDKYINYILTGMVEIPSNLVSPFLLKTLNKYNEMVARIIAVTAPMILEVLLLSKFQDITYVNLINILTCSSIVFAKDRRK